MIEAMGGNNGKLNFVLIGVGGMGRRWAGVLADSGEAVLKSVVDIDLKKAEKIAGEYKAVAYKEAEDVLRSGDIDAAVIVLPNKFLASVSKLFLERGKHVLCEKPGAMTSAEIKKALSAAQKSNSRYMIGFNHRFHPGLREAKKLSAKGVIGDLLFIRARYGFGGRPGYEKEWRHDKNLSGGGELIDQGIHLIDLARWFLGDIKEVRGLTQKAFWKSGVEDNAFVLLKNVQGQVASLHASWSQWKPVFSFEIFGRDGYLIVEGLGKKYGGKEKLYIGRRSPDFGAARERIVELDNNADGSLRVELAEFISSIREKREPRPCARDGLAALKIVENIYKQN